MSSTTVMSAAVRDAARAVIVGRESSAAVLTRRITDSIPGYGSGADIDPAALRAVSARLIEAVLDPLVTGAELDVSIPREAGRARAAAGVPLSAVMRAYRIGATFVWEQLTAHGNGLGPDDLIAATAQIWQAHDRFLTAMTEAYQQEMHAAADRRRHERGAMVEALVTGQLTARASVWEVADLLGLPVEDRFVVVVGEGAAPVADVEDRLRAQDFRSGWHVLPDGPVGIVALTHDRRRAAALEVLDGTGRRLGVSPVFAHLTGSRDALGLARLALDATDAGTVAVFDESLLAVVAAATPAGVSDAVWQAVFGARAVEEDDEILLDTFAAWSAHRGSADAAAAALFCHPNTVRQRLRRLEQRTGRAVDDPRHVAELLLAIAVRRRRA